MSEHKKMHEKFRNLMSQMAEELVSEEAQKMTEKKVIEMMRHENIPVSTYTLAAFTMGMELTMKAMVSDDTQHVAMGILAAMNKVVKERMDKVKKATDKAEEHGV